MMCSYTHDNTASSQTRIVYLYCFWPGFSKLVSVQIWGREDAVVGATLCGVATLRTGWTTPMSAVNRQGDPCGICDKLRCRKNCRGPKQGRGQCGSNATCCTGSCVNR